MPSPACTGEDDAVAEPHDRSRADVDHQGTEPHDDDDDRAADRHGCAP
jgi:hypothetical protein